MKREYTFQQILEGTLLAISSLPTEEPVFSLAGFGHVDVPGGDLLNKYDNAHYSMGTAYYRLGIRGIADLARKNAQRAEKTAAQKEMLLGIAKTYDAVSEYLLTYSQKIQNAPIADRLFRLSANPPRTFEDAVQLFYLMWCIRNLRHCSDIGRLDQHLRPFYEADLAAGILTREKALKIICNLFERLNEWGSGDTLMNIMLGGKNQNGEDDSCELSILMMEAGILVNKTEPHINVRIHKGTSPDFLHAALKLQQLGYGQATVYNDEVILPEMARCDIPESIAYNYANDGCTEVFWDGYGDIEFNHIDALAVLDLTLNNGHLSFNPEESVRYFHSTDTPRIYTPHVETGFESGNPENCIDYEELYQLFLKQYRFQLKVKLDELYNRDAENKAGEIWGLPFLNGTFDSVLCQGTDLLACGLPMNSRMVFLGSLPTLADSLVALKIAVYEKKLYTLAEVKKALQANFEGFEVMRTQLLNLPKFGNDEDKVDLLAARLVSDLSDTVKEYRLRHHYPVFPALIGWMFISEAYGTGAMPDGRREKDPIAEHYCATPGRAKKGITAHVSSISKAPLVKALGVAPVHLSLPRNLVPYDEKGISILQQINEGCIGKGLMQYNIAVYDNSLLKDAQIHPEAHSDLIVRVWGFCAKFVDLSREMQDHIISRTE